MSRVINAIRASEREVKLHKACIERHPDGPNVVHHRENIRTSRASVALNIVKARIAKRKAARA